MSKRRRLSELMFAHSHGLKYPVTVVAALSGTGTETAKGVFTVVASNVATRAYLVFTSGTNIGTLVGTASGGF